MLKKTRIFLVRHGQTEWNLQKRFQGHKNSPLTIKGKKQALEAKKSLSQYQIHRAYVSPLKRAKDTIDIILDGSSIEVIEKKSLKEINLGSWEGQTIEEMERSHPDEYIQFWNRQDEFFLPGAETYKQLQNRVITELKNIFKKEHNKNILVVSHWIAIKVAIAYYTSIPMNQLSSLTNLENGKFFTLINENGNVIIKNS
ncbi:MAG: histidine phosphatase family protein [Desulfobacula sp.]|nr:histidine phosphatase family protein [Desulfobacula sp.]